MKATSSGRWIWFLVRLAHQDRDRVSSSGGSIATVRPQPKRDLRTILHPLISFG